ncbi:MAG: hypothetical protein FWE67_08705 [Planctomycetaceae bacterium]|nr:hypothetical protein [Planctomycetaceae bacterium]
MRDIGEGTIRRIDWQELIPAVLLLRVFNASLGFRMLFVSLLGLMLALMLCASLPYEIGQVVDSPVWKEELLSKSSPSLNPQQFFTCCFLRQSVGLPLSLCWDMFEPLYKLPQRRGDAVLWLLGMLVISFFVNGILARTAALRLTIDERESPRQLAVFFWKRGWGFASSVIILGIGIAICLLIGMVGGLPIIKHILPIHLLCSFFAAVLFVGLVAGFPLLISAVAVDGSDGFDAVSRMFSYLYQRPLHYIVYWLYAAILGVFLYLFVSLFAFLTFHAGHLSSIFPSDFLGSWFWFLPLMPAAAMIAWFWTSSVAIYILLRRSVDATPFNEVYRLEPPKQIVLPKIED